MNKVIELDIDLQDRPGELLRVLQTIYHFGGNLITIVHNRAMQHDNIVPMHIQLEIEQGNVGPLQEQLIKQGILIKAVFGEDAVHHQTILLIGRLVDYDVRDVIDSVAEVGAKVRRIEARIGKGSSTIKVLIDGNDINIEKALEMLSQFSNKKQLLMVC